MNEKAKNKKIVVLAILERNLSSQIPLKQQLRQIAAEAAEKLGTDSVKVGEVT